MKSVPLGILRYEWSWQEAQFLNQVGKSPEIRISEEIGECLQIDLVTVQFLKKCSVVSISKPHKIHKGEMLMPREERREFVGIEQ